MAGKSKVTTGEGVSWRNLASSALSYTPEDLLKRPTSLDDLRSKAAAQLLLAYIAFKQPRLSEIASLPIESTAAALESLLDSFLAAPRGNDDLREGHDVILAFSLTQLRDRIDLVIESVKASPLAALVLAHRKDEATQLAEFSAGKGTAKRGLSPSAPRTRLVFRLFTKMRIVRAAWTRDVLAADGVSEAERELFKATLHERVREIIDLPPLAPEFAIRYHRVGVKMLRDAAGVRGDFTTHPAFQKGGEFEGFDRARYSKDYLGALSEAWKSVAKRAESDTRPAKCQKPSRKG